MPHLHQILLLGNNEMHSRDSKSWEWGITLTSLCFRLSNEMALRVLFHSPPGVLFTFPSRYWFTIGH